MNIKKYLFYGAASRQLKLMGDWIRWSASLFTQEKLHFGHGTDNAWDEAVHLVLQLLYLPIDADPRVFGTFVLQNERKRLIRAIKTRVEQRKPLPYITQQAWCVQLPFYVDERVLIPRSLIAEWIAKQFSPWIDAQAVKNILEVGTGSGCLAVAAALCFPQAELDAVDINANALAVAATNVNKHAVADQINLIQGDVFSGIASDKKYDIIFSNPPYVGELEMASLPPEYYHEPRIALQAPDQGLSVVIKLLRHAAMHLREGGILVVEVGNSAALLEARFPALPCTWLQQENGGEGLLLLTQQQLQGFGEQHGWQ